MEDFWIWKSNIYLYEGINFNKLLDISEEGGGPEFRHGIFSLGMNLIMTLRPGGLIVCGSPSHTEA